MGTMEEVRADSRNRKQLRPLVCRRNLLHRAQGDTVVLAAVYGPKAGTKKGENPEKASIEVILKPKTGQIGKNRKEYEMILRRTLQSICILTIHPNTTTSVILQEINAADFGDLASQSWQVGVPKPLPHGDQRCSMDPLLVIIQHPPSRKAAAA